MRDRLLVAAASLYARAGLDGATVVRLAGEAGVAERVVAGEFESVRAAVTAGVAACVAGVAVRLPRVPVDPPTELCVWCRTQVAALREVRGVLRRVSRDVDAGDPTLAPVLPRAYGAVAVELRGYARRLRDAGHPGARGDLWRRAALLTGALFTAALWRDDASAHGRDLPDAEALVSAFLDPARAAPAPSLR